METYPNPTKPTVNATGNAVVRNDGNLINYREILDFLWRLRYYILAGVGLALIVAFIIIRVLPTIYGQTTWIQLNKGDDATSEFTVLRDLTGEKTSTKMDRELFILKSPSMMCNVVEKLGLDYRYIRYGTPIAGRFDFIDRLLGFKKYDLYGFSPFELALDWEKQKAGSVKIKFRHKTAGTCDIQEFIVNGQDIKKYCGVQKYGAVFCLDGLKVAIKLKNAVEMVEGSRYECSWTMPYAVATSLVNNLTAEAQKDKRSNAAADVIILSYKDESIARARDILNVLVAVANKEAREYSNMAGMRALDFINERLETLSHDLGAAETNFQNYRSSSSLIDVSSQSNYVLTSDQKNQERLDEIGFQLQVLRMIQDCLDEQPQGVYASIPANVGLTDAGLNSIIASYNALSLERERMVANSSENNPRVQTLNTQLDIQKRSIQTTLSNLKKVYETKELEVQRNISVGKAKLSNIPRQELQIQQLGRKMNVIEPLYLLLQQKKEETQIAISSQIDNFRVLEPAFGSSAPISPNRRKIYIIAILLGFLLPPTFVFLRLVLRTTVENKEDISSRTAVPILAIIPHFGEKLSGKWKHSKAIDHTVIIPAGRNSCTEAFGMLRTNLRYIPDAKVIQVTSSVPGEGKSFVSSNLAVSLARLDKKVLLMGMDIRKPALGKIFAKDSSAAKGSVVSYLIGKTKDLDLTVNHSSVQENLDIVFAGPVAPNPLELLSKADLGGIIAHFRDSYDYIIIDSAPFLPVHDSFIINPFVDATLYVVRSDYTNLKIVDELKNVLENPLIPVRTPNIVINDLDYTASKYQYGYGKGYGYGYGYGYGHRYGYGQKYGYGYGKGYGYGYGESDDKKA